MIENFRHIMLLVGMGNVLCCFMYTLHRTFVIK